MKKMLRRAAWLFAAALLVCSLCGCSYLDELRANQATYDTDGNICWKGSTYKLLNYSDSLYPEMDYDTSIYVTEPDIPVLLCEFLALDYLNPSTDGRFLETEEYNYYCREDVYEEISGRLQADFEPEVICYFYDTYDEQTWDYEENIYTLTQEQVEAIELVVTTVEPVSNSETGIYPSYDYSVYIYECSADMLLQTCSTELAVFGEQYYLLVYTETDVLIFTVPEGCNEIFDGIVSAYETAEGWTDEDYEYTA